MARVKRFTETRNVLTPLTESGKRDRAMEMVRMRRDRAIIESESKSVAQDYKARIKRLEDELTKADKAIRDGDMIQTECEVLLDYENNNYSVVAKETGQIIEDRRLTTQEKQAELPGTESMTI